jgi:hypothetical protein
MEIVQKFSQSVLELGDKAGNFLIPAIVLAVIALFAFAIYSFRALRVIVPVSGMVFGYFIGTRFLGTVVSEFFQGYGVITPALAAGVVLAIVLGIFCIKDTFTALLIIGLAMGYFTISDIAHTVLRSTSFVQEILLNTTMEDAIIFSTLISIACALVMLYLFRRHFNLTYIFLSSISASTLAFAVPGVFLLKDNVNGVLALAGIGAFIGLVLAIKQFRLYRYSRV